MINPFEKHIPTVLLNSVCTQKSYFGVIWRVGLWLVKKTSFCLYKKQNSSMVTH